MNRQARSILMILVVGGTIALVSWKMFEAPQNAVLPVQRSSATVERAAMKPMSSTAANPAVAQSLVEPTLRQRFREAKDYARFVEEIGPMAVAGNAEAQYLTAKSLRWCAQTSSLYFVRPNGEVRSLEDVQARAAARPVGISQQEITTIYTRCRAFLESPELRKMAASWSQWLDKAVDAGYPAAIAEHASILESQLLLDSHSQLPHERHEVDAESQARDLALSAVESGDPDAIFSMSDWVRAGQRTENETATLISAWKIVACQNGYNCSPDSDWMHSVCNWDPQCANGRTYTDYLQRQLGSQYDDALRLAKSINEAIVAKDAQALKSYL
jgi:hypothetical protein